MPQGEFTFTGESLSHELERPFRTPGVLLVGESQHIEFRPAVAVLSRLARLSIAIHLAEAAESWPREQADPGLIVVCQSRPGQIEFREIEPWLRRWPLARVIHIVGSWCEGKARGGAAWPAALRCHWHAAAARLEAAFEAFQRGTCPEWGLPLTASAEEKTISAARRAVPLRCGVIAIRAPGRDAADWLADACVERGYSTARLRGDPPWSLRGVEAVLWDGGEWNRCSQSEIATLASELRPQAPLLVLLDFPRADEIAEALSAGATAVVSKPCGVDELFGQLDARKRNSKPSF